jgi:hypothetical protein
MDAKGTLSAELKVLRKDLAAATPARAGPVAAPEVSPAKGASA